MSTKIWQWNDVIDGVPDLCDDVQLYQDTLKSSIGNGFEKDVRYKMLGAMRDDFGRSLWIMAGAIVVSRNDKRLQDFKSLIRQECDAITIQDEYTFYLRRTVTTSIHFHLDHFLRTLAQYISGNSKTLNIFDNATVIKNHFSQNTTDIDVFSALCYTRNSFHNNGTHSKQHQCFNVENHRFEFNNGVAVSLGWQEVSILIRNTITASIELAKEFPPNIIIPD